MSQTDVRFILWLYAGAAVWSCLLTETRLIDVMTWIFMIRWRSNWPFGKTKWSALLLAWENASRRPGPWFNIKTSSYQYRESHCGHKTVVRSSYLHNGISYAGKMSSLYWIRALCTSYQQTMLWVHMYNVSFITWHSIIPLNCVSTI